MSPPHDAFETLLAACLAGSSTPAQHAQLAAFLRADPARRAAYVRQMRLDSMLRFVGRSPALALAAAAAPQPTRPRWWWPAFASAAAAILLAAVWTSSRTPAPAPRLTRALPPLVERHPGALFGELAPPTAEPLPTRFLLPAHLLVQLP
ncbi:MAG: hypothetical protein NTV51_15015 [Verrucomicrobia bacterium]|nr:hypothetical protein [Verrucomicrobiota bacterium]